MSHIPAAAMPHAQPHQPPHDAGSADHVPPPVPVGPRRDQPPFPFTAAIVGGVLALGGAATAAWLLRRETKPTPPAKRRATRRKPAAATKRGRGRKRASRATPSADA